MRCPPCRLSSPSGRSSLTSPRYPEELADRSWDNVGLLVGNEEAAGTRPRVLVTNDLTFQVATDAIDQGASVIVSYRACRGLYPVTAAASSSALR